jgi:hypothetical protein
MNVCVMCKVSHAEPRKVECSHTVYMCEECYVKHGKCNACLHIGVRKWAPTSKLSERNKFYEKENDDGEI